MEEKYTSNAVLLTSVFLLSSRNRATSMGGGLEVVTDHIMQSHSCSRNVCELQFHTQYNQMLSTNACRSCSSS